MKIDNHIAVIEKTIAAHEVVLTGEQNKLAAERAAIAAGQASADAKLAPFVEAVAGLRNRCNELTARRDVLAEDLRIGKHQLAQQDLLAGEFERLAAGNFGHFHAEKNPGVFLELLTNRPASMLALHIVPRLKAWITDKENEIAAVEAEIAALAQSAKLPKMKDVAE